jgi:hypothetical protein
LFKYTFAFKSPTTNQSLFFGLTLITICAALSELIKHNYMQPEIVKLILIGWTAGFLADILNIDLIEKPIHYFLFISFVNISCMLYLSKF